VGVLGVALSTVVLAVLLVPRRHAFATLAGVVRSAVTAPIAGATVCATCTSCRALADAPVACTVSDREGHYSFTALAAGRYRIAAAARGHAASALAGEGSVLLESADQRSAPDIELAAGGVPVAGVVRDAAGVPIAKARVRVMRAESPRLVLEIDADEHGAFSVLMPSGAFQISARAPGYARTDSHGVAPARHTELSLEPALPLRGRVVHARSGEPVANVRVRATARDRAQGFVWATTDAQGDFTFAELSAGSYLITASGAGVYGELPRSVELGTDSERAPPLRIEGYPALQLEGRVELERGDRCTEGYVLLGEPDPAQPPSEDDDADASTEGSFGPEQYAQIAHDGTVRFDGVPAGRYFASVQCYGHVLQRGPVLLELPHDADRELVWQTQPATRLTARVIDRRGAALAGARIAISWPGRDGRRVLLPAITTDDGTAEIVSPRCGDCRLMPAENVGNASAMPFAISADGRNGHATLTLEGDATLELEVRDESGAPVDGLQMHARAAGAQGGKRIATALGDGRYRFVAVPTGAYVVVGDDGVNPARALWGSDALPLPVESGATLREQTVFERGSAFSGRVLDSHGRPVAGVWLSALPEEDFTSSALVALMARPARRAATDRDGRFVLAGLSPRARFKLRAERSHGSAIMLDARTPERDLTLTLPAPAQVKARALDASGAPLTQFTLRARSLSTELVLDRLVADPEGRLSWTLPPGLVELTVIAPDGQSGTRNVELTAGATLDAVVQVGG